MKIIEHDERDTADILVTGMAWHTALGNDIEGVWQRLLNGDSGITALESDYLIKSKMAAAMPGKHSIDIRKKIKKITREAINAAAADAHLDLEENAQNIFLIVGTSFGSRLDDEKSCTEPLDQWVIELAGDLNVTPLTLSTACSSASDAILLGAELIRSGIAGKCICGGADVLGESKRLAHSALGTMSPTALRSFDKHHDGTVLGEGAGFLVLERAGEQNIDTPYAFLRGCGSSNDAAGLTAPDEQGEGIRLSIERSLEDAGLSKKQIGLINAHGSGTHTNDRVESAAYGVIFNENFPVIFATKGAFGHSLGATGAFEAIALILGLSANVIPPIHGLDEPIPDFKFPLPIKNPMAVAARYGLSLTIGFGGFNTSLVFERYLPQ